MKATRKARKPVSRTCRLEGALLVLTVSNKINSYRIEPLAADFGIGVRLRKQEPEYEAGEPVETDVYDVNLDTANRQHDVCCCPGFLRWNKPCKHLAAIAALLAAGKLLPALEAMRAEKAGQESSRRVAGVPSLLGRLAGLGPVNGEARVPKNQVSAAADEDPFARVGKSYIG